MTNEEIKVIRSRYMDIEKLKKILRKNNVPEHYGIYIDCKGYSSTVFYYIYCDEKNQCVILSDLPYTEYWNLELLEE